MNKITKTTLVIGVLTILLRFGLDAAALSEAEVTSGEDFTVIELKGDPEFVVSKDIRELPKLVLTSTATTSEGPVTITQIVGDVNTDILFGCTPPNFPCEDIQEGEHIFIKGTWDFGGGNKLYTDTRTYISEVSVTKKCEELINNLDRAVIRGGTGRFADAKGYIEMDKGEFCWRPDVPFVNDEGNPDGKPLKLKKGSIEGLIVLP